MDEKKQKDIVIDRRPFWVLILVRGHHYIIMGVLLIVALRMGMNDAPEGLTESGWSAIILFIVCAVSWIFQLLPLAMTGLLAIAAQPLLGIASYDEAYSSFGHSAVFFLLGVFILAAALMRTGLSTRLAVRLLKGAGHNPKALIFRVLITASLLSFFMNEHAVAALMFPIILEFARILSFVPYGGSYGRLLFLAMGWGCVVGGIATLLGGARAPLAIGFLEEFSGQSIGFMEWTGMIVPVFLAVFLGVYMVLVHLFSVDVDSVALVDQSLRKKIEQIGKVRLHEQVIAIIFLAAILGWVFFGQELGMASIAMMAVIALFIFRVVRWVDLEKYVNWGIILLYGGAIGLGNAMHHTGAGEWLVNSYILPLIDSPFTLFTVLAVLSILLTEAISNSAVVAVLMPIALTLAPSYGMDPKGLVLLVAAGSGLAFALPMASPTLAITFSSGYYRLREIILPALMMHAIAVGAMLLTARFWWPLFGVKVF
jgi:solute carrier family 13 (sodium-dependent dicarboxylate transporter), member 2/3/5